MSPLATQRIAQTPRWAKDELWRKARAVPSLDLRFADNKSLVDATTGQSLVTFSRASGGTYVDSQGVIRNATTNLNTNSEAFNTYTTSSGSVVADQGIAPNGTLTADELTSTGGGVFKSIGGLTSGATYVISVYAKYISGGTSFLFGFDANPSSGRAVFNLQTGAFVSAEANVSSYSITPVGNGWHRVTVTAVATSTSAVFVFYNGTSGSKWLIWGAQLEQSSTVGEYIPTTSTINSAPRFDHNPSTGESLGLLVEEQRSNLALNTVWAGGVPPTNWTAQFAGAPTVVTSNLGNADGGVALSFTCNASRDYLIQTVALAANTTYIFSVYVEDTSQYASASANVISLNNGPAGSTITGASGNPIDKQRVFCSIAVGETAGNVQLRVGLGVGSNATGTIVLSRPQLEAGAFPTSYIKTQAATATRAADIASITGANFSSWYRQSEGTVSMAYSPVGLRISYPLSIDDGTTSNFVGFGFDSAGNRFARIDTSGVTQASITQGLMVVGAESRTCIAFAINNVSASINGGTPGTDLSATIPTVDRVRMHALGGSNSFAFNGTIRRLTYWPQRLSNAVLQSITQ